MNYPTHQYPEHMESPVEPVWVSNIRKSVVNIFRINPLWVSNFQDHYEQHFGILLTVYQFTILLFNGYNSIIKKHKTVLNLIPQDHTGKVEQLNFGVEEETLVGRCMNWYTSMKYPEHMADKFTYHREEYMEEDAQRGHPESR